MAPIALERGDALSTLVEPAQQRRRRCPDAAAGSRRRRAPPRPAPTWRRGAAWRPASKRSASWSRQIERVALLGSSEPSAPGTGIDACRRRSARRCVVVDVRRGLGAGSANSGRSLERRSSWSGLRRGRCSRARGAALVMRPLPDVTSSDQAFSRRASVPRASARPVVGRAAAAHRHSAPAASLGAGSRRVEEIAVRVVPQLAGADRRHAGDQHQRSSCGSCMTSPAVSSGRGVSCSEIDVCDSQGERRLPDRLRLRAQLGGGAERIGEALGRALVVGREGDAHVAVVEDGVVVRRRPCRSGSGTARPGRRARRSPP